MSDGQPDLLNQVRDRIRRKHYSIRTEQGYVDWIRRFVLHHNKGHSRDMGAAEVEGFPEPPRGREGVSASTQNQAKSAVLFLTGRSSGSRFPGPTTLSRRSGRRAVQSSDARGGRIDPRASQRHVGLMIRLSTGPGCGSLQCADLEAG